MVTGVHYLNPELRTGWETETPWGRGRRRVRNADAEQTVKEHQQLRSNPRGKAGASRGGLEKRRKPRELQGWKNPICNLCQLQNKRGF